MLLDRLFGPLHSPKRLLDQSPGGFRARWYVRLMPAPFINSADQLGGKRQVQSLVEGLWRHGNDRLAIAPMLRPRTEAPLTDRSDSHDCGCHYDGTNETHAAKMGGLISPIPTRPQSADQSAEAMAHV